MMYDTAGNLISEPISQCGCGSTVGCAKCNSVTLAQSLPALENGGQMENFKIYNKSDPRVDIRVDWSDLNNIITSVEKSERKTQDKDKMLDKILFKFASRFAYYDRNTGKWWTRDKVCLGDCKKIFEKIKREINKWKDI